MGWMYQTAHDQDHKVRIVRSHFEFETDQIKCVVLDMAKVGNVYYLAVHATPKTQVIKDRPVPYVKNPDGSYVFAGVVLTQNSRETRHNFGVKDMDETALPYYFGAPERILRLLSPTNDPSCSAQKWRDECRKVAADKKVKGPPLGVGQVVKHPSPLKFGARGSFDTFHVIADGRAKRFYALDGEGRAQFVCRMTREQLAKLVVVAPSLSVWKAREKVAA